MRKFKCVLPVLLLLCLAAPAQAATFNVSSLVDGNDAVPGDTICATSGGACTLRAAVQESGTTPSTLDDIVLGPGTHSLVGRLDVLNHDVRIRGAGARVTTIDQTQATHGVALLSGTNAEVRDLGLTGGSTTLAGGGLYVDPAASQAVLLERVLIADNEVLQSAGGNSFGGGIYKLGPGSMTVRSSTITNNRALYFDATVGGSAYGGGIAHTNGPLNLINVTIEGNEASALGPGASSFGGGVNSSGGATALSNVTLAGNAATGASGRGGNLASNISGHLNVENSIVASGAATALGDGCNVSGTGTLTSSGRNIEFSASCAFGPPHLSDIDPLLGALSDNRGPTDTILPAANSPAIDAAIGCPTPAEDQRGVNRPAGAACDIGAVERVRESDPGADVVAPIVSDLSISPRRFRTGPATRRTRSLRRAAYFAFHLSEPALVDFSFRRRMAGRRGRNGICRRPARRNRGRRRCVRWVAAGSRADNLREGTQLMRFNGSVTRQGRGRTLGAGSYRVRVEATDPAGNRSAPVGGRFRVVR